jgi:hypothetical protein
MATCWIAIASSSSFYSPELKTVVIVVIDGRCKGIARRAGERALAAIGVAGELPRRRWAPIGPSARAPLPRVVEAVPLLPLRLRAEDGEGARRRVAAANPAASPPAAADASHAVAVELTEERMRRRLGSDFSPEVEAANGGAAEGSRVFEPSSLRGLYK